MGHKPKSGDDKKLFRRHQIFIEHYIRTRDSTVAAVGAGYKPLNAKRQGDIILRRKDVQAALKARDVKVADKLEKTYEASRQDILESYLEIRELCLNSVGKQMLKTALHANDSICKLLGFNAPDRQEVVQLEKIEIEFVDDEVEDASYTSVPQDKQVD